MTRWQGVLGDPLSPRELLVSCGLTREDEPTTEALARELYLSVDTLRTYLRGAYAKLGCHTRLGLYRALVRRGYLPALENEEERK